MENESLLRLYLADPTTDADGNEIQPFLSTPELEQLLAGADDDIYGAAAEGWRIKAARAVELVNSTTDNSTFSLSDIHKHCMLMVDHFSDLSPGGGVGAQLVNVKLDSGSAGDDEGDDIVQG